MGIGDMINKLFKKEGSSDASGNPDRIDLDNLIQLPGLKTEKVFLYKSIDFEDISIRDKE